MCGSGWPPKQKTCEAKNLSLSVCQNGDQDGSADRNHHHPIQLSLSRLGWPQETSRVCTLGTLGTLGWNLGFMENWKARPNGSSNGKLFHVDFLLETARSQIQFIQSEHWDFSETKCGSILVPWSRPWNLRRWEREPWLASVCKSFRNFRRLWSSSHFREFETIGAVGLSWWSIRNTFWGVDFPAIFYSATKSRNRQPFSVRKAATDLDLVL